MKRNTTDKNTNLVKKIKIEQIEYLSDKKKEKLTKYEKKYKNYKFLKSKEETSGFYNWIEWKFVYKMLFSNSIDEILIGIDRLSIWKLREGLLIHSLETTLDFFLLKYKSNESKNRELNLAYGMAIVRMVDGFKQSLDEQGRFFNSIHLVMENFELPLILVNIRHSSTHAQLENLEYLKYAGDIAIEWLKERYWKIQAEILQFFELKVLNSINLRSLSKSFNHSLFYVVDILVENIIVKCTIQ